MPPSPPAPCLLGALPVAVGTVHQLQAIPRAVHQELQQPVHWGQPTGALHRRRVPVGKRQSGPRGRARCHVCPPPSRQELKIGWRCGRYKYPGLVTSAALRDKDKRPSPPSRVPTLAPQNPHAEAPRGACGLFARLGATCGGAQGSLLTGLGSHRGGPHARQAPTRCATPPARVAGHRVCVVCGQSAASFNDAIQQALPALHHN